MKLLAYQHFYLYDLSVLFTHYFYSQFPVLSQSSGSSNLGDSSSESGGDVKASELCHRPLLFVSSGPPSLHNGNPAQGTYHQPSSPSSRLHHPQHNPYHPHHHHHHPHNLITSHHTHHHHQLQANQVNMKIGISLCFGVVLTVVLMYFKLFQVFCI